MLTYKDITFCTAPGCKNKCERKLTEEIKKEAETHKCYVFSCTYFCDENGELL